MFAHPALPPTGLLDLHCHILPGIDDGCQELTQSLECVRLWIDAGFSGAVCTPHVCTTWYPDNNPRRIAGWVQALQREIDAVGWRFDLWTGGEVRLGHRTIDWFAEFGVPTLGPGKAVLIDWWGNDWPVCCDATIEYLLAAGYQPILAHPERMGLEANELEVILDRLAAQGVWLQGNLNSLSGGEGPYAQALGDRLMQADRYYLLASDTHTPDSVPGRQQGLRRTLQKHGEEHVARLLADRPREVLSWGIDK